MTGATSFIGTHLLECLIEEGYSVTALKRPTSEPTVVNALIQWMNINDIERLCNPSESFNSIIHIATDYGRNGSPMSEQYKCNVLLPLKLLELMPVFKTKLFISTDSFFGKYEKNYGYMRSYMASKRHFLELSKIYAEEHKDVCFINLRLEHVYGERDKAGKLIPNVINKMKNDENVDCTTAEQKRDFIYIDDVVSAYMKVLNETHSSGYYDVEVGTGQSVELKKVFELIKKEINSNSKINYGAIKMRDDEIMESHANTSFLTRLGWHAKYSLSEGLEKMLRIKE
ncbi:NAD-dependent epimerase/dehydratase [Enterobacter chuandaensis]|uniref:NAD-dependent epimerase/dehydratase n=1 Tax=Enterobacter chuandaensis TaxID=2497875 RepID=UPI002075A478|nr:NAD-dependent epimerase/dehydratase [Enterobacter chuandaensis]MCM7588842.1 NAD-dependent epimerase/dehydratase [Enterobacter chuandaensis]